MNLSAPFIRRPVATTLLALALLSAGVLALQALPVAPLPRVDFPTVQVQGQLPGASPETMASSVAMPLERRFGRIAGITEITSTSSLGATNVSLQFSLDRDVEAAARDVQAAIQAASADLPANLPSRPTWRKMNPADAPILIVALTSPTLPMAELYDLASTVLAQRLSQVTGVGQVFVGGGQQPALRVRAEPGLLAARGLTLQDLRTALARQNVNLPKGALQNQNVRLALAVSDQIPDAKTCAGLIVAMQNGVPVYLRDVAQVFESNENSRTAAWFDGQRAVLLIIRRQPGANIMATVKKIHAVLPALVATASPAIHFAVGVDRSTTIQAAVDDVELTLVITVALVVAVVFLFLRDLRATLVPSVAVPLSLVGTFAAMYLLDYSLDNLSLMALTISTGFVVDDAIVVTENVIRHLERGLAPRAAALKGVQEVGFTVVSMTLSLVAVFLPILMMGGMVGRLFREFAAVLSLAIFISGAVSLTVTPAMCAGMLRAHVAVVQARDAPARRRGAGAFVAGLLGRFFAGLERLYARVLRWALRHPTPLLVSMLVTVGLSVFLFVALPKGLFPQQDTGMLMGATEAAQDASFLATVEKQRAADATVRQDPAVAHVISFIGGNGGGGSNTGNLFVSLRPLGERKVSADAILNRLRPKLEHIVGFNVFLQAAQDLRMGGRSARTQYQYTLQDAQIGRLRAWAPKLLYALQKLPQLKDVASDQQNAGLETHLIIDRDQMARFGVTLVDLDNALYDAFGQRMVATRYTESNTYRTILEVVPAAQAGPQHVQDLWVQGSSGPVSLSLLTRQELRRAPLTVNHQGQFAAVTLSFNLAPGVALGEAVQAIEAAKAQIGLPQALRADFQGTAQAFRDTSEGLPKLLAAALVAVYIVLGILYESYLHPITILSTLPSAGVGALLALALCQTELSIIAFIGIILLIGIVKKNAILVVDFALQAQRDGAPAEQAIYDACLLRLRPILMTTLAALFAGLPLALGQGTGSELRRPLGITIIGGLALSQLLTLLTTPVLYLALERARALRIWRPFLRRRGSQTT